MNNGKHKITGEEVNAEHLLDEEGVDPHGYYCPGCHAGLVLCSFLSSNKQRLHFRAATHFTDCVYIARGLALAEGAKGKADTRMADRYNLVSKLIIRPDKPQGLNTIGEDGSTNPKDRPFGTSSNSESTERLAPTNRVTTLLETIVDDFLDFPNKRHISPLSVPGVNGDKYHMVFRKINTEKAADYSEIKIYYGELIFSKPPRLSENHIDVPICVWVFNAMEKKSKRHDFNVRVNLTSASPQRVNQITHSIDCTRLEQSQHYDSKEKPRGYTFFLGRYVEDQGFTVNSPNMVCFRCTQIRMPDFFKRKPKDA